MEDARFEDCDEWLAAVQRALAHPDASPILAAKGIDGECVLAVARCEASAALRGGISTASHSWLAELTGLPRSTVLRARLAVIELGLADLVLAPAAHGHVHRVLHHR